MDVARASPRAGPAPLEDEYDDDVSMMPRAEARKHKMTTEISKNLRNRRRGKNAVTAKPVDSCLFCLPTSGWRLPEPRLCYGR